MKTSTTAEKLSMDTPDEAKEDGPLVNHLMMMGETFTRALVPPKEILQELEKPPRFAVYLDCTHFALADDFNGEDHGFCFHDADELGFDLCGCHCPPHLPGRYYRRVECENPTTRPVRGSNQTRLRLCCRCADELEGWKLDVARKKYGLGKYDRPSDTALLNAERQIVAHVLSTLHKNGERPPMGKASAPMFAVRGGR